MKNTDAHYNQLQSKLARVTTTTPPATLSCTASRAVGLKWQSNGTDAWPGRHNGANQIIKSQRCSAAHENHRISFQSNRTRERRPWSESPVQEKGGSGLPGFEAASVELPGRPPVAPAMRRALALLRATPQAPENQDWWHWDGTPASAPQLCPHL